MRAKTFRAPDLGSTSNCLFVKSLDGEADEKERLWRTVLHNVGEGTGLMRIIRLG